MHTTKLRKVGGSVMLAVPPALLDILRVKSGDNVDISVESGRLVAEPRTRRHYTLEELLAQCKPSAARNNDDREWVSDAQTGRELI